MGKRCDRIAAPARNRMPMTCSGQLCYLQSSAGTMTTCCSLECRRPQYLYRDVPYAAAVAVPVVVSVVVSVVAVVVVLLWCCCGVVVVLLWCCCGVVVVLRRCCRGRCDARLAVSPFVVSSYRRIVVSSYRRIVVSRLSRTSRSISFNLMFPAPGRPQTLWTLSSVPFSLCLRSS